MPSASLFCVIIYLSLLSVCMSVLHPTPDHHLSIRVRNAVLLPIAFSEASFPFSSRGVLTQILGSNTVQSNCFMKHTSAQMDQCAFVLPLRQLTKYPTDSSPFVSGKQSCNASSTVYTSLHHILQGSPPRGSESLTATTGSAAKKRDRLDLLTLIGRRGQYPSSLHGQVYGTSSDLHALGLRSLLSRPTLHNRLEDSMSDVLRLPYSVHTYAHTFSIQKSRTSAGFRAPERNAS
uniref:Uncharacterized protein n=1 Tax=Coccidioides posadasii RMSCC 3488 TaxID=454284 RepID=A0A0J6HZP0_COCPO|nr:hypothetical protein CPAG_00809 [Coccidioides posadasii RMSCC 3488]